MSEGGSTAGNAPRPVVTLRDESLDLPPVAADQVYDRDELEGFVRDLTRLPSAEVRTVLDLYDERLVAAGVLEGDRRALRYYDHASVDEIAGEVVDPDQVAVDAERLAGVARTTAARVLEAELAYLEAKGLA